MLLADIDFLFGRYGLSVWPKKIFLTEMALADMVLGRIGIDPLNMYQTKI